MKCWHYRCEVDIGALSGIPGKSLRIWRLSGNCHRKNLLQRKDSSLGYVNLVGCFWHCITLFKDFFTSSHFEQFWWCLLCWHHTHTHNCLTALYPGWPGTRKVKPIWILLKQETMSSSGISWAICKSAPRSRQIITPAPHHSVFYKPDALPAAKTNSVRALKALLAPVGENVWIISGNFVVPGE